MIHNYVYLQLLLIIILTTKCFELLALPFSMRHATPEVISIRGHFSYFIKILIITDQKIRLFIFI